jgi:4-hydroxybenzoate polyprenyltransferase
MLGSLRHGVATALAIARYHIVLVAAFGCLVFGWIATGQRPWAVTLVGALDWFLINLLNRVTDIDEDRLNGIRGTDAVAARRRALVAAAALLMAASFVVTHLLWPRLTPARALVQLIGLAYNFRVIPTGRGRTRFKEIYFLKNFMSAVLFVLTCFVYPLAAYGRAPGVGWPVIALLALFFVPFELTYEILYDLRDLEGDRRLGVPTFPVAHGPRAARCIIDALLAFAAATLAVGFTLRILGVRELLLLAAPVVQLALYRPRLRRGLTPTDCILITHAGTAQLALFLAGTAVWAAAGLPANIYLP